MAWRHSIVQITAFTTYVQQQYNLDGTTCQWVKNVLSKIWVYRHIAEINQVTRMLMIRAGRLCSSLSLLAQTEERVWQPFWWSISRLWDQTSGKPSSDVLLWAAKKHVFLFTLCLRGNGSERKRKNCSPVSLLLFGSYMKGHLGICMMYGTHGL